MAKQDPEALYMRLLHKYAHIGCPAAHYEDNCDRPGACAENGRCLDLSPEGGSMTASQCKRDPKASQVTSQDQGAPHD